MLPKISRASLVFVLLLSLGTAAQAHGTIKVASVYGAFRIINVAMGKVRFYIQRPGGRSNPNGAGTVTAVIAVRG